MNLGKDIKAAVLAAVLACAAAGWAAPPSSATPPPAASASAPASAFAAPPARALSAAGCQGPSCSGQDPYGTQCASGDVLTLEHQELQGRTVNLRWSRACEAAWAELTGASPGDDALVQNGTGETQHRAVASGTTTYSPMVNDRNLTVRACVTLRSGSQKCTLYH
ncbi:MULTISPECIES: DUF2690 domain-containing protein [Streptomyces]|uniref:DUF2690 domain-containing protein n=1 Tax=Streptomyces TaxID=1883 RepID=UPI00163C0263|nr:MULTISPECIES: DUF2690 domain-containing protein [Streptomyces]MBC2874415.1 DUF2690 domain-containing protein [Streptomyces sp. TYQ1024]UBI40446.1 YjfA family protein [Streptomyces mobaraensis]UKW33028.1 YjfA family protein [Streptomyces sp. TYQ1024]